MSFSVAVYTASVGWFTGDLRFEVAASCGAGGTGLVWGLGKRTLTWPFVRESRPWWNSLIAKPASATQTTHPPIANPSEVHVVFMRISVPCSGQHSSKSAQAIGLTPTIDALWTEKQDKCG